ncbi:MAG TPA: AAA family ATPase, partial [Rugosimonospora sp.]|nr:AAA family ATPase [Rugosimonospora sp.]
MRPQTLQAERSELVYESARTRVRRSWLAGGGTVVRKEPLGPDAAARVRHERDILRRLAAVPGVVRLAPADDADQAAEVLLEDLAGTPLSELVSQGSLGLPTVLEYARELTNIIAAVHARGVVHKDINPGNIVLAGPERKPVLLDFEIASTFVAERPGYTHHREMLGTLAYLAPEQTGRTGLAVDHRADLYALGATLYELVSGEPPFGDEEPMRLLHDTLVGVPVPLAERDPLVPRTLSDIVDRLLEKEPDRRYQSASGLAHDLAAVCDDPARPLRLGERDYPARLSAPCRPVGRDHEITRLWAAFNASRDTADRCVLVAGGPGVGKSTLVNELRPIVAARGGWFVTGKFDQYRHDITAGAVVQALRALCRLLLAEPEVDLVRQRELIAAALGPDAALLAGVLPELGVLLDVVPASTVEDPVEATARMRLAGLELLRAIVSPERPVVLVLDDLQWGGEATFGFIDGLLGDETLRDLLLVGAYRSAEVDAAHPIAAMRARWQRLGIGAALLELDNLPAADLGTLLAEMLRLPAERAAGLGRAIAQRTAGNPYDTIELVNALRRDGVLALGPGGWSWDEEAIRRYVGQGDVADLLRDRIGALPPDTRELLSTMACLGSDMSIHALAAATGRPVAALWPELAPALEDGLLVLEQGEHRHGGDSDAVLYFRHDRVQQVVHDALDPLARKELLLRLARTLAGAGGYEGHAAELFVSTMDEVRDAAERRLVAGLFRTAAARARHACMYDTAERFLTAEVAVWRAIGLPETDPSLVDLEVMRHAVLFSLGRLDEADE